MALFNIFDIAGSGMSAQSVRLNLVSSNLANADSVAGSPDEAYKARHPVFQAALMEAMDSNSSGVVTRGVIESQSEPEQRYQPNHPMADENGYVYVSNVDPVAEMTNMISASRSYQNNVQVLDTVKDLMLRTLRLGE
ncbi:MAG: flagellar basal body rod protein FlgC [Gammaproteobacteria bacterium]|nr:flagellar basal body rod protein FlgC [Gammaproteobacteria bacterium]